MATASVVRQARVWWSACSCHSALGKTRWCSSLRGPAACACRLYMQWRGGALYPGVGVGPGLGRWWGLGIGASAAIVRHHSVLRHRGGWGGLSARGALLLRPHLLAGNVRATSLRASHPCWGIRWKAGSCRPAGRSRMVTIGTTRRARPPSRGRTEKGSRSVQRRDGPRDACDM